LAQMQDGHIKYFEDSPESIGELLTQVVYCALMINDWIRIYYGWDTQQMRQEYESLLKQLSGKKYERKTF